MTPERSDPRTLEFQSCWENWSNLGCCLRNRRIRARLKLESLGHEMTWRKLRGAGCRALGGTAELNETRVCPQNSSINVQKIHKPGLVFFIRLDNA